jgi:hypothetical protein
MATDKFLRDDDIDAHAETCASRKAEVIGRQTLLMASADFRLSEHTVKSG